MLIFHVQVPSSWFEFQLLHFWSRFLLMCFLKSRRLWFKTWILFTQLGDLEWVPGSWLKLCLSCGKQLEVNQWMLALFFLPLSFCLFVPNKMKDQIMFSTDFWIHISVNSLSLLLIPFTRSYNTDQIWATRSWRKRHCCSAFDFSNFQGVWGENMLASLPSCHSNEPDTECFKQHENIAT